MLVVLSHIAQLPSIALKETILVVEDDIALRKGMSMLLRAAGLDVSVAGSLAEARQQLSTAVPSRMILDLNLPDGLGMELLQEIRHLGLPTRVLILSGAAASPCPDAQVLGIDAYVIKPPDWDKLLQWASGKGGGDLWK